ncbi:MAG TPA: DMT family transporter [Syntrophomonadaceae bacterium]|nr:DMT family transporter [Syntrophomonadaceae bacterium]
MKEFWHLAVAALAGATMALQGTFNAALGKIIGIWPSTLMVHVIGTVTAMAAILIMKSGWVEMSKFATVPWYAYLGGVLNVLIIFAVVKTIPQVGVGNATTAIVVAQILTALLVDALGAFGMKKYAFHYYDLLGVALLAIGARILLMK